MESFKVDPERQYYYYYFSIYQFVVPIKTLDTDRETTTN
jgi:hypothetical protein